MVQGGFQVFRHRLEVKEAIRFMSVLSVGARALFAADWDVEEPKRPFEDCHHDKGSSGVAIRTQLRA